METTQRRALNPRYVSKAKMEEVEVIEDVVEDAKEEHLLRLASQCMKEI